MTLADRSVRGGDQDEDDFPLLSVIIPTCDRPQQLLEALTSVRRWADENPDVPLEIVIANDGRPEGVRELVVPFSARLVPGPRRGPAGARNAGMAAARGAFLAFLDDDDAFLAGHVRRHLAILQTRPEVAAVFGQIQTTDDQLLPSGPVYPLAVEGDPFHYLLANWHQIGSVVVRAEVRTTVGPFNEDLVAGEEQDWLLRLFLRHPVEFVAVPCMLFRQRPAGAADRYFARQVWCARRNVWVHARRAGGRRPGWRRVARIFLRQNGHFARLLLASAEAHAARGDAAGVRYAVRAALLSSPPHVAVDLLRRRWLLPTLVRSQLRRTAGDTPASTA